MCLGEQLIRAQLFLSVATLIQQFSFALTEGDPVADIIPDDVDEMARSAPKFKVYATPVV